MISKRDYDNVTDLFAKGRTGTPRTVVLTPKGRAFLGIQDADPRKAFERKLHELCLAYRDLPSRHKNAALSQIAMLTVDLANAAGVKEIS